MVTKLDARQTEYRGALGQLTNNTNNVELDNLLDSLNSESTPPLYLRQSDPASLVVNIGGVDVVNPETGRRRIIPPIAGDTIPSFSSGTITFPSASGGNATPSVGNPLQINMSANSYLKVGVFLDINGEIVLNTGTQGTSLAAATNPQVESNTHAIGFVVLRTDASQNIQNITADDIYQFVGNAVESNSLTGPASSTTNALAKFPDATGNSVVSTGIIVDPSNNVSGIGTLTSTGAVNGATPTEMGYLSGVTSAIQTQLDSKLALSGGTLTGYVTAHADPTNSLHLATKQYVDAAINGVKVKEGVKAASTANLTLSGQQTVDGVSLVAGDRVLVKNQSTASENGVYIVASGTWTRAEDVNSAAEINSALVTVAQGNTNANTGWYQASEITTLGSDSVNFQQFFGAGTYTADGSTLGLTGSTFFVATGGITNTQINNSAAIEGTKISPDFGSQDITTTGTASIGGSAVTYEQKLSVGGSAKINALYLGRAGGGFDAVGYNAKPTSTSDQWEYGVTNSASWLQFKSGGFIFYGAASGTGGTPITKTELASLSVSGDFTLPVGKLGIGTASGGPALHVAKATGTNFVAEFTNTTASSPYGVRVKEPASPASGYPLFQVTDASGTTQHFRVNSVTGNVGIGVNPTGPGLHVKKATGGHFLAEFTNTTAATPFGVRIREPASPAANFPLLLVGDDAGTKQYLRVDSSTGNVGIGVTSSPAFFQGSGLRIERQGTATLRLENSSTGNGFELSQTSSKVEMRALDAQDVDFLVSAGAQMAATTISSLSNQIFFFSVKDNGNIRSGLVANHNSNGAAGSLYLRDSGGGGHYLWVHNNVLRMSSNPGDIGGPGGVPV